MFGLILGRTGTGKTKYIEDMLAKLAQNGDDKLLILVPDQSSFDTEKVFLDILGPKLCRRIHVLGFNRLCDYVFSKTGGVINNFVDDGEKYIIMSMAIESVQDNLILYEKQIKNPQLTEVMLNAQNEYKKSGISTDLLREKSLQTDNEILKQKLVETALVCDAYNAILHKSYIDPLEKLDKLYDILIKDKTFDNYTIAVDGFSGFTVQEQNVIDILMQQSKDFFLSVTTDDNSFYDDDLFFETSRTAKTIKNIAKKNQINILNPIILKNNFRFTSNELCILEKNIFRIDKEKSDLTPSNIEVFCASTIYEESDYVAQEIRKLVIQQNYSYNDIAVICRSISQYNSILDTAFNKYEIPFFMDKPQNIQTKALIKLTSSILEAIISNFDSGCVLSILKTGLAGVSYDDVSIFENYILMWSINHKKFLQPFKENPQGFTDRFTEEDKKTLKKIEKIRSYIITPLLQFKEETTDATGREITTALYNLLNTLNVPKNIIELSNILEQNNEFVLAQEQIRIWEILMNVFDKLISITSDYTLKISEYETFLSLQFDNEKISTIPQGFDQVTVATADRVRLNNKKAVFVIGCIDGEFPHTPVSVGAFTDNERIQLKKNLGLPINDSLIELSKLEKYFAYYALCSPSEKLFITTYMSNLTGEEKTPSSIITEVLSVFKNLKIKYKSPAIIDNIWAKLPAFESCAALYGSNSTQALLLKQYFKNNAEFSNRLNSIEQAIKDGPFEITNKKNAEELFGKEFNISASRIEKYNLCKFAYFCRYGLNTQQRKIAEIDDLAYGSLIHYVLERFLKSNSKKALKSLTIKEIKSQTKNIINDYAAETLGGVANKSERFKYLLNKTILTVTNLVLHISKELAQSEFTPIDYELDIGKDIPAYTINIPNGGSVNIYGNVDRVDVMEKDDKLYLRIIDYKSGTKKFNLSDVLYGLNLQMLIYLNAISQNGGGKYGKNIIPAGVLYMPAILPQINAHPGIDEEKIETEKDKSYKMNGLILDDEAVISGMEKEKKGIFIPVVYKNGIKNKGFDSLATTEEMGAIFKRIDSLVIEMAQTLHQGKVEAYPAKSYPAKNPYDACKWCEYTTVCNYNDNKPCKNIFKLDKKKVLEDLKLSKHEQTKEDS